MERDPPGAPFGDPTGPVGGHDAVLIRPARLASSSPVVHATLAANHWSVPRQVHHAATRPGRSVDVVLSLHGPPIVTLELKSPWTGATGRYHGQLQYRQRDARQTLFRLGR